MISKRTLERFLYLKFLLLIVIFFTFLIKKKLKEKHVLELEELTKEFENCQRRKQELEQELSKINKEIEDQEVYIKT